MLYYILYYIILYHIILYYIILFYTMFYYVIKILSYFVLYYCHAGDRLASASSLHRLMPEALTEHYSRWFATRAAPEKLRRVGKPGLGPSFVVQHPSYQDVSFALYPMHYPCQASVDFLIWLCSANPRATASQPCDFPPPTDGMLAESTNLGGLQCPLSRKCLNVWLPNSN